jgi:NMT1-like family
MNLCITGARWLGFREIQIPPGAPLPEGKTMAHLPDAQVLKKPVDRVVSVFAETFGLARTVTAGIILLLIFVGMIVACWLLMSPPPNVITITAGPKESIFTMNAEKYAAILERNGVKLNILPSGGSLENLKRLSDPAFKVDIGFVQGGVTNTVVNDKLVSLGSTSYQPLLVFCRSEKPLTLLSELAGKRLAIGPEGSGTRSLALTLLEANGIKPGGSTTLLDLEGKEASRALLDGKVDAAFLMGESASRDVLRALLRTEGIHLLDFAQADAYTRKITYLNKLVMPRGGIEFGRDLPPRDVNLIGPTVEIIARPNLHPALSDLLLEAAREVHGHATLLQKQGEFPAPLEHDFRISEDASRFYKSGKSLLYRWLPFWLASLMNRIIVVFAPMVLVVIPGVRIIPRIYRWQVQRRIYRWYGELLVLERSLLAQMEQGRQQEMVQKLDQIEQAVNRMKVPASFADQFYGLRGHIVFVRSKLMDHS